MLRTRVGEALVRVAQGRTGSFFDESKMGLGFVVVQDEHYRNQDESV